VRCQPTTDCEDEASEEPEQRLRYPSPQQESDHEGEQRHEPAQEKELSHGQTDIGTSQTHPDRFGEGSPAYSTIQLASQEMRIRCHFFRRRLAARELFESMIQ
jgi:hypothetical protein